MKIVVYAISKNEEKFALRWAESMSEADEVIVLDTGSTDKTIEILTSHGIKVFQKIISPWRFDAARNASLDLVSKDADICVCCDLDEIFSKGWRNEIEKVWVKNKTQQGTYLYVWNHLENGKNGITFNIEKIHSRFGFKWTGAVHEVLTYLGETPLNKIHIPNICIHHYADNSKPRSSYLPLLELAVSEDPTNDRNTHYLGREYFFSKRYEDCIKTLKKHLKLPTSKWRDERCASLRYIAKSYFALNRNKMAEKYFKLAVIEAPHLREPRLDIAKHYYLKKDYLNALVILLDLLKIKERNFNYISEPECWSSLPHDLASICFFHLGNFKEALNHCLIASELEPDNKRLRDNIAKITKFIHNL